ncbi:TPA: relaxase/mobilization nuclease domain-containing protein [Streptococcus suis]
MPITKIKKIQSTQSVQRGIDYIKNEEKTIEKGLVHQAMAYIENEDKTLEEVLRELENVKEFMAGDRDISRFPQKEVNGKRVYQLVSSHGLSHHSTASEEFEMTRMNAKRKVGKRGAGKEILAYHIIQSFSPEDDLTPEEIHELGRKLALEFTGGNHEFVVATHLDKAHLHNHIIFNATNMVTMKKIHFNKSPDKSLRAISDKHAGIAGAKIIDEKMKNSRREYIAYRKKNVFRYEIKERLDFLLKHSTSLEDFKLKAKELDLMLDASGKEVRYKLLDKDQQRAVRDRTLSKRGNYSLEGITQSLKGNQPTYSIDEIKTAYQEYKKSQENDFEMRIQVHDWQVMEETSKGIYLELEHGLANKGTVLIPSRYVDKLPNGGYEIFIQKNDWFYFTNPTDATKNKAMKGEIIAKQLSYDNGEIVVNKNPYISRIDQLVREFNFLSAHGVTDGTQFENLANSFREQVQATQSELDKLDTRLAQLNKLQGALLALEEGQLHYHELAHQILKDLKLDPTTKKSEIDKLVKEVTIEHAGLQERFDSIVSNAQELQKVQENIKSREVQGRTL